VSAPSTLQLVKDRSCGPCAACCIHLSIDDPALKKAADVVCPNYDTRAKGCSIYADRPAACRTFYCAWRLLPELGNDWRPDICGILIRLNRTPDGDEVYFKLIGGLSVIANPNLAMVVAGMIAAGVKAHLVLQGTPELEPATIPLNASLEPAIRTRDMAAVTDELRQALDRAVADLRRRGAMRG
jgi:uncharacterized cysteine cluster protein YcgN (CxxCxxCC family)